LLNAAQGHPMLVELKNGETLNGHLVNCDTWMNLTLKEVVQTNPEGTAFFRLPEVYVRGNNVKTPSDDSKIRFIRKNAPPWLGRRGDNFKKNNTFFTSEQNTSINAPSRIARSPGSVNENQHKSEEQTWRSLWRKVSDKSRHPPFIPQKSAEARNAQESEGLSLVATLDHFGEPRFQEDSRQEMDDRSTESQESFLGVASFKVRGGHESAGLSNEELYDELRRASSAGDYPRIREVLRILIRSRGVKPDRRHYQALLLANANAQHGSPVQAALIVDEMEQDGIRLDSGAYHALLHILAVHPDYILRRQVLEELRQRWFTLSNEGWHDVIFGLLKDKQLELAVETLQSVQQEGIRIQPWLYDMLIFNLCDVGEFDEALAILRLRVDNGEQLISGTVWHYLLDTASRAYHHQATHYAWRKRVGTSYLNPSSGVCLNVLDTAARHGDFRLATDVIRVLGNRNQALRLHHYESLIETYLPSELRTAFTLLALMNSSGTPPAISSTRPIFLYLRQSPHLPDKALSVLRQVAKQQRAMPAEAVNVVIEAYIYHGKLDQALDTYKTLHTFCPSGPVTDTFNTLFRGCRSQKDTAMFLASEMVALKIAPNLLTYDRLILVCLQSRSGKEDYEDAWRYYEEMRGAGWWPRPGTAMALARHCCSMGDERIWRLQGDDYSEDGITKSVIQRMVNENWMDRQP
ncbi:MAG: hypothetical protein Q9209_006476, partial [Squamulea sp. 1 TL-2023]